MAPNDVCFRTIPPVLLARRGEYGEGACDCDDDDVDASVLGDFAAGFVSKALPFAVATCVWVEAMPS